MTGFGQSSMSIEGRTLHCEISSLNHKYFDLHFYAPTSLMKYETKVRKMLKEVLHRGRVRLNINFSGGEDPDTKLYYSEKNAQVYIDAFSSICKITGSKTAIDPNIILGAPDVVTYVKVDGGTSEYEDVLLASVKEASQKLLSMRIDEGKALGDDLFTRMNTLLAALTEIKERVPAVKSELSEKLREKIAEFEMTTKISEERFAQELLFFCERADITEEIVRTKSHIQQFKDSLSSDGCVGRKLVFISQELNREATTMGAKASDPELNKAVVLFKEELAKVREQAENIE